MWFKGAGNTSREFLERSRPQQCCTAPSLPRAIILPSLMDSQAVPGYSSDHLYHTQRSTKTRQSTQVSLLPVSACFAALRELSGGAKTAKNQRGPYLLYQGAADYLQSANTSLRERCPGNHIGTSNRRHLSSHQMLSGPQNLSPPQWWPGR